MINRYYKNTIRNYKRSPFYTLINISGLAIAITCATLILFYVTYHLSFDGYHENARDIYRIITTRTQDGASTQSARTPAPVGPLLKEEVPEVLNYARFSPTVKRAFSYNNRKFFESGVFYADQSVFEIFSFKLLSGDPATALEAPFTMVLTQSMAEKYFQDEEPLGKFIKWDNNFEYRVTGVMEDVPDNSHFHPNVLASFETFIKYDERIGSWEGGYFQTYLLLKENTNEQQLKDKLEAFKTRHIDKRFASSGMTLDLSLQPLTDIHLKSSLDGEMGSNSNIQLINSFIAIAILILIVACINFANLTLSMEIKRIRSLGIKKIFGASRRALFFQIVGESVFNTLLAALVGVLIIYLALPYFNALTGMQLLDQLPEIVSVIPLIAGIILVTGILAGLYPATLLSATNPLNILRSGTGDKSRKPVFQSVLVVFQFMVSVMLFSGSLIIYRQQVYLHSKDLGFNKENLMVIALQNRAVRTNLGVLKNEVLSLPGVISAGASSMVPGEIYLFTNNVVPEGYPEDQPVNMDNFLVDETFLDTYRVDIVEGRGFSSEFPSDSTKAIMINETAARRLGWDNPIGKKFKVPGIFNPEISEKEVIGVFRDIHQRSLYNSIAPTYIQYVSNEGPIENRARRLTIRIEAQSTGRMQQDIEKAWNRIYPDHPIYSFYLDNYYDNLHESEARLGNLFIAFTLIALFIGSLGLLGLTAYMTRQKIKEIGIRKVLGSTTLNMVYLLARRYLLLVIIANLVAFPVVLMLSNNWLSNYPYAIEAGYMIYLVTALVTGGLALVIMSYHIIKASYQNPAITLRHD